MSEPEWCIRSGRPTDRALLASFTRADPAVSWQVDVEQFIRTQLLDWTFDPHAVSGDPRLLWSWRGLRLASLPWLPSFMHSTVDGLGEAVVPPTLRRLPRPKPTARTDSSTPKVHLRRAADWPPEAGRESPTRSQELATVSPDSVYRGRWCSTGGLVTFGYRAITRQ
ncbi:MAG: hypothetical protein ACT4NY_06020 [Pseudonocardiales bacterium]